MAQNEPKAWDGSKEVTEQDALSAQEEVDRILNSDRCGVTERRAALETLCRKNWRDAGIKWTWTLRNEKWEDEHGASRDQGSG